MTDRERLLQKMARMKAMAEQGVEGEKDAAERALHAFMKKHKITEKDLEAEKVSTHWIRWHVDWERRLLHQITYMNLGSGHSYGCVGTYTNKARKMVGIECTAAQYIEIQADYEFYRDAFEEEINLFYRAFLEKNRLFPPDDLVDPTIPAQEMDPETAYKIARMKSGIDHRTRRRALERGER